MVTPQLSYQHAHLFREVEDLVNRLDELRSTKGSFVCHGADEAEIVGLTMKALRNKELRSLMNHVIEALESYPDGDWICRSSPTVQIEPKSMDSVFVPRDQQREGVFLPYALYSLGKLFMNFFKPEVQAELKALGHDPASVRLAVLMQVVGGARDDEGIVGRERTVSFSASVYPQSKKCKCNIVFGLPLLATRPWLNGSYQPATISVERFSLREPFPDDAANTRIEWRKAVGGSSQRAEDASEFCQTHKAILIPEKGIVYQQVRIGSTELLERFRVGSDEVRLPIPRSAVQNLLRISATATEHMHGGDPHGLPWRIDGIVTQSPDRTSWEDISIVGANQIFN